MIQCDTLSENCFGWYHGACVGVSPIEGRWMEQHGESFVCSICSGLPALPIFTIMTLPGALLCLGTSSVNEFVGLMIVVH